MEIWKDVIGFEGFYQVSNTGRIKTMERTVGRKKGGTVVLSPKIKILKPHSTGYVCVTLYSYSIRSLDKVHRLVAKAFLPNIENKSEVNHKNGIKHDNRVENLEWVTHRENMIHANENNLMPIRPVGSKSFNSKLTENDVYDIRILVKANYNVSSISKIFSVSRPAINYIKNNIGWKHVILR